MAMRLRATALLSALALAASSGGAGALIDLKTNTWTRLADGPCNPYACPIYEPQSRTLIALLADGNGTAHMMPRSETWTMALPASKAPTGGDQPLMKPYTLRNGRPNYANMPLFNMVTRDSRRHRILAGATTFMAHYHPLAKTWRDLEAKVELYGHTYPGVPPVAWGSMCYDRANDQIVLLPGGAVYNFDHWASTREATGAFGTWIYECRRNTWSRPQIGPAAFYKARELLRPIRIALQGLLTRTGEAALLERNGKRNEARQMLTAQIDGVIDVRSRLVDFAKLLRGLGDEARLRSAAGRIDRAVRKLAPADTVEGTCRAQSQALDELLIARDEYLWSHPRPRFLSPMAYLPGRDAILLFGGTDGRQHLNDTWLYDCRRRRWQKKNPRTLPRPRAMHILVYDSEIGAAVMAGGTTDRWAKDDDQLKEVWVYDADADDWKLIARGFPFKRGCASYFAEYSPPDDIIVLLRDGKETFVLRPRIGERLPAPPAERLPRRQPREPFLPPKDDPAVLARWKALPANTWVSADPPREPGEHGWGMMGWNSRMGCAILWGGGHSTHQANEISLYFPGANRWVEVYPPHRIDIPPWSKACGNPGGVDIHGGAHNLHARRGLAGNGAKTLITTPCFSPYWYGPKPFLDQPERWGKTTTFEYDCFSRRWSIPCPPTVAMGMCYPDDATGSVVSVSTEGAWRYDFARGDWRELRRAKCPVKLHTGEGANQLYIEKKAMVFVPAPRAKDGPVETWALDLKTGAWRDLKPTGRPPGIPTALAFCEADNCVYAGCFTGFDQKTPEGQEAVYSFWRNAWLLLPTQVQKRVARKGQPYRREGMGAYHCAWSKVVYSPRHNLLMNFQDGGGLWVMRPELKKLAWGE